MIVMAGDATSTYREYYLFALIKTENVFFEFSGEPFYYFI